ncbi:MAG: PAS domain S-box protein [candidate division Zixibacteria bacterium]|nr:PAS domain S-box protein [candidate division Zixibacteria bacterium]
MSLSLVERVKLLEQILDLSSEGIWAVDKDGIIIYVNESFERITGVAPADAIGRHVTEVVENTRIHIVVQTGVAERDQIQRIGDTEYIVSRLPMFENGECVGVLGQVRFHDVDEVNRLARRLQHLQQRIRELEKAGSSRQHTRHSLEDIVAIAPASQHARRLAMRAAATDATVLLLGETGVGKEVYAQAIHRLSARNAGPFIRLNCSAIQESLFESELFGYAEGAFTGARRGGKKGKFELANSGTILLDEVGDMPLSVQSKLLRVLQSKEIDRVGGGAPIRVDVRIIAATNKHLSQMVADGQFRRDLYYRLNVLPVVVPPLRLRTEDIPQLVTDFWEELTREHGIHHKELGPDLYDALREYHWPGNVRELRNLLERLVTVVVQNTITGDHVRTLLLAHDDAPSDLHVDDNYSLAAHVHKAERRVLSMALARADNNRSYAAKLLGISRALLYKKMHQHGLFPGESSKSNTSTR